MFVCSFQMLDFCYCKNSQPTTQCRNWSAVLGGQFFPGGGGGRFKYLPLFPSFVILDLGAGETCVWGGAAFLALSPP